MHTPLPETIHPGSYRCIRVWVPDDPGYMRAVRGSLSYLGNWFAWERDSAHGGREAAEEMRIAYGMTISDLLDGIGCGECEESQQPTNETVCPSCGGIVIYEDDMGQVVTDVYMDYETGELVVEFGPCCIKRYSFGGVDADPAPNPVPFPDEYISVVSRCGKACSLIDRIAAIMQAAVDYRGNPLEFAQRVKSAAGSDITLSTTAVYLLNFDVVACVEGGVSESTIMSADMIQKAKCQAVIGMEGIEEGTNDEANYVLNSLKSSINQYVDSPGDELVWVCWEQAWQAIGENDRKYLLSLGAQDTEADCTCPDAPEAWEEWLATKDWVIVWDLSEGSLPFGVVKSGTNNLMTASGLTISDDGSAKVERQGTGSGFAVTDMFIQYQKDPDFGPWGGTGFGSNIAGLYMHDCSSNAWCVSLENTEGATWKGYYSGVNSNPGVLDVWFDSDWKSDKTPNAPVLEKVVFAGTGAHPYGG